jgi:hypothetical protein
MQEKVLDLRMKRRTHRGGGWRAYIRIGLGYIEAAALVVQVREIFAACHGGGGDVSARGPAAKMSKSFG